MMVSVLEEDWEKYKTFYDCHHKETEPTSDATTVTPPEGKQVVLTLYCSLNSCFFLSRLTQIANLCHTCPHNFDSKSPDGSVDYGGTKSNGR
jgi:hypothetical protein